MAIDALTVAPSALPCRPRGESGFSLHDTLIALAISAILATIGIPSFKYLSARQELVTAVNTVVGALHLARSEAIKRRLRVSLCPSLDGRTCMAAGTQNTAWHHGALLYVDSNGNHILDGLEPVIRHFDSLRRIRIYTSRIRDHVTYQASGYASGSNSTFLFCDPAGAVAARKVILANSGRPRLTLATEACPAAGG